MAVIKVDENDPVGELEPTFPYRDVRIKHNIDMKEQYELMEEIGRGKFGTVYRCREKRTGIELAAKMVAIEKKQDRRNVEREVELMRELQHPRLIQIYDAYVVKNVMTVILELIEGGELFERVIDDDFVLTEKSCTVFMRQICEGVAFIHANNIIHLDLKPENILCLTRTGNRIKIIDFGLARRFEPDKKLQVLFGTPEFVAPEVVNFEQITTATDMWSVGVICYVLLSGLSPFMGDTDLETMTNVTMAQFDYEDEAFDNISSEAKDFISKLLIKEKDTRFTADECLEHSWLKRKPVITAEIEEELLDMAQENLRNFVETDRLSSPFYIADIKFPEKPLPPDPSMLILPPDASKLRDLLPDNHFPGEQPFRLELGNDPGGGPPPATVASDTVPDDSHRHDMRRRVRRESLQNDPIIPLGVLELVVQGNLSLGPLVPQENLPSVLKEVQDILKAQTLQAPSKENIPPRESPKKKLNEDANNMRDPVADRASTNDLTDLPHENTNITINPIAITKSNDKGNDTEHQILIGKEIPASNPTELEMEKANKEFIATQSETEKQLDTDKPDLNNKLTPKEGLSVLESSIVIAISKTNQNSRTTDFIVPSDSQNPIHASQSNNETKETTDTIESATNKITEEVELLKISNKLKTGDTISEKNHQLVLTDTNSEVKENELLVTDELKTRDSKNVICNDNSNANLQTSEEKLFCKSIEQEINKSKNVEDRLEDKIKAADEISSTNHTAILSIPQDLVTIKHSSKTNKSQPGTSVIKETIINSEQLLISPSLNDSNNKSTPEVSNTVQNTDIRISPEKLTEPTKAKENSPSLSKKSPKKSESNQEENKKSVQLAKLDNTRKSPAEKDLDNLSNFSNATPIKEVKLEIKISPVQSTETPTNKTVDKIDTNKADGTKLEKSQFNENPLDTKEDIKNKISESKGEITKPKLAKSEETPLSDKASSPENLSNTSKVAKISNEVKLQSKNENNSTNNKTSAITVVNSDLEGPSDKMTTNQKSTTDLEEIKTSPKKKSQEEQKIQRSVSEITSLDNSVVKEGTDNPKSEILVFPSKSMDKLIQTKQSITDTKETVEAIKSKNTKSHGSNKKLVPAATIAENKPEDKDTQVATEKFKVKDILGQSENNTDAVIVADKTNDCHILSQNDKLVAVSNKTKDTLSTGKSNASPAKTTTKDTSAPGESNKDTIAKAFTETTPASTIDTNVAVMHQTIKHSSPNSINEAKPVVKRIKIKPPPVSSENNSDTLPETQKNGTTISLSNTSLAGTKVNKNVAIEVSENKYVAKAGTNDISETLNIKVVTKLNKTKSKVQPSEIMAPEEILKEQPVLPNTNINIVAQTDTNSPLLVDTKIPETSSKIEATLKNNTDVTLAEIKSNKSKKDKEITNQNKKKPLDQSPKSDVLIDQSPSNSSKTEETTVACIENVKTKSVEIRSDLSHDKEDVLQSPKGNTLLNSKKTSQIVLDKNQVKLPEPIKKGTTQLKELKNTNKDSSNKEANDKSEKSIHIEKKEKINKIESNTNDKEESKISGNKIESKKENVYKESCNKVEAADPTDLCKTSQSEKDISKTVIKVLDKLDVAQTKEGIKLESKIKVKTHKTNQVLEAKENEETTSLQTNKSGKSNSAAMKEIQSTNSVASESIENKNQIILKSTAKTTENYKDKSKNESVKLTKNPKKKDIISEEKITSNESTSNNSSLKSDGTPFQEVDKKYMKITNDPNNDAVPTKNALIKDNNTSEIDKIKLSKDKDMLISEENIVHNYATSETTISECAISFTSGTQENRSQQISKTVSTKIKKVNNKVVEEKLEDVSVLVSKQVNNENSSKNQNLPAIKNFNSTEKNTEKSVNNRQLPEADETSVFKKGLHSKHNSDLTQMEKTDKLKMDKTSYLTKNLLKNENKTIQSNFEQPLKDVSDVKSKVDISAIDNIQHTITSVVENTSNNISSSQLELVEKTEISQLPSKNTSNISSENSKSNLPQANDNSELKKYPCIIKTKRPETSSKTDKFPTANKLNSKTNKSTELQKEDETIKSNNFKITEDKLSVENAKRITESEENKDLSKKIKSETPQTSSDQEHKTNIKTIEKNLDSTILQIITKNEKVSTSDIHEESFEHLTSQLESRSPLKDNEHSIIVKKLHENSKSSLSKLNVSNNATSENSQTHHEIPEKKANDKIGSKRNQLKEKLNTSRGIEISTKVEEQNAKSMKYDLASTYIKLSKTINAEEQELNNQKSKINTFSRSSETFSSAETDTSESSIKTSFDTTQFTKETDISSPVIKDRKDENKKMEHRVELQNDVSVQEVTISKNVSNKDELRQRDTEEVIQKQNFTDNYIPNSHFTSENRRNRLASQELSAKFSSTHSSSLDNNILTNEEYRHVKQVRGAYGYKEEPLPPSSKKKEDSQPTFVNYTEKNDFSRDGSIDYRLQKKDSLQDYNPRRVRGEISYQSYEFTSRKDSRSVGRELKDYSTYNKSISPMKYNSDEGKKFTRREQETIASSSRGTGADIYTRSLYSKETSRASSESGRASSHGREALSTIGRQTSVVEVDRTSRLEKYSRSQDSGSRWSRTSVDSSSYRRDDGSRYSTVDNKKDKPPVKELDSRNRSTSSEASGLLRQMDEVKARLSMVVNKLGGTRASSENSRSSVTSVLSPNGVVTFNREGKARLHPTN